MNKVKFSVFGDLHFSAGMFWDKRGIQDDTAPPWFCGDCDERLDSILNRAKKEAVDFVIHCGDFCHNPRAERDAIEKYNNFEIPTYHVLGNHEAQIIPLEEVIDIYKMPSEYYYFDKNGFRFVAMNANYLCVDGEYIPYSVGNYGRLGGCRNYFSPKQLAWFEEVVMSSPYPVVVFGHADLSRDDEKTADAWKDREAFRDVIRKAHANKKRVLMYIGGHMHCDGLSVKEHVCYFNINSPTMYWMPAEHKFFPEEFHEKYTGAKNCLIYNDPVHAIVTLSEDGTIDIEGMKSSFYCGVDHEMVMGTNCCNTVQIVPHVLSEKLWLPIEL